MSENTIEIIARLEARFDEFEDKLDEATRQTEKSERKMKASWSGVSKKIDAAAKGVSNFAGKMQSIGKSAFKWTFIGATAVTGVSGALIKLGSDADEAENLFEVSFGNMADEARAWSKALKKELGVSEYDARRMAGTFNVMFEAMGANTDQSFEMSRGLTQLSNDMASFHNMKPEEAFEKLQAAISGESEPLKRLGYLITDTEVKAYALANGIGTATEKNGKWKVELTETEKVLARYGLIMDVTEKAQGDLSRTADSTANTFRRLRNRVGDALKDIGVIVNQSFQGALVELAPMIETLTVDVLNWFNTNKAQIQQTLTEIFRTAVDWARQLIGWVRENKDEIGAWITRAWEFGKEWGLIIAGALIALGPLSVALQFFAGLMSGGSLLIKGLTKFGGWIGKLIGVKGVGTSTGTGLAGMAGMLLKAGLVGAAILGFVALLETFNNDTGFDNFITRMIDKKLPALGRAIDKYYDWLVGKLNGLLDKGRAVLEFFGVVDEKAKLGAGSYRYGSSYDEVLAASNAARTERAGQNALGTNFWRGGLTWVGEQGKELVNLPRGSQVIPAGISRMMAAGAGGGDNISLNISFPNANPADVSDADLLRFSRRLASARKRL